MIPTTRRNAKYRRRLLKPKVKGTNSPTFGPESTNLVRQLTNRTVHSTTSSVMLDASTAAGVAPYSILARTNTEHISDHTEEATRHDDADENLDSESHHRKPLSSRTRHWLRLLRHEAWDFLRALVTPPTIALAVSLIVALVNPLKALFVEVPGYHIHQAPDGCKSHYDNPEYLTKTDVPQSTCPGRLLSNCSLFRRRPYSYVSHHSRSSTLTHQSPATAFKTPLTSHVCPCLG